MVYQVLGPPARGVPSEASQHSRQAATKEQEGAACFPAIATNALPSRARELTCAAVRWRTLAAATPEGSMLVAHSCRPLRLRWSPADRSAHHTLSRSHAASAPLCRPTTQWGAGPHFVGGQGAGAEIQGLGNIQGGQLTPPEPSARRWAARKPPLPASPTALPQRLAAAARRSRRRRRRAQRAWAGFA